MRLHTVKGVESQFFLLSDIGEAALVLPAEPSFYWVSTNNGDDNQLFSALLEECDGDFVEALKRAVELAPRGAKDLMERRRMFEEMQLAAADNGPKLNRPNQAKQGANA